MRLTQETEKALLEVLNVFIEGRTGTYCQRKVAAQLHAELTEKLLEEGRTW